VNSVSYEYRNNSDIMGAVPLEMPTLFKNTTLNRTNVLSIKKNAVILKILDSTYSL
jgi:hypothetical protein